jgi:hypothetical protein
MGGCCTKKEPKQLQTEEQVLVVPFNVETKLDDVPNWARLEWLNIIGQNEMSMDQDNLDWATQNLKEGENIPQANQDMIRAEEQYVTNGRQHEDNTISGQQNTLPVPSASFGPEMSPQPILRPSTPSGPELLIHQKYLSCSAGPI